MASDEAGAGLGETEVWGLGIQSQAIEESFPRLLPTWDVRNCSSEESPSPSLHRRTSGTHRGPCLAPGLEDALLQGLTGALLCPQLSPGDGAALHEPSHHYAGQGHSAGGGGQGRGLHRCG